MFLSPSSYSMKLWPPGPYYTNKALSWDFELGIRERKSKFELSVVVKLEHINQPGGFLQSEKMNRKQRCGHMYILG